MLSSRLFSLFFLLFIIVVLVRSELEYDKPKIIENVKQSIIENWPEGNFSIPDFKEKWANIDFITWDGQGKLLPLKPKELKVYFFDTDTLVVEVPKCQVNAEFEYKTFYYVIWTVTSTGCLRAHYENKLVFEFRVKEKGEGTYELVFLGLQDLNSNDEGKLDAKFECGNGNIIEDFLKNQLMKIFLKWYKDTINQKIEKSVRRIF